MARELQVKYVCDCEGYHSYGVGETYEPVGWLSAIESSNIASRQLIEVAKVEDLDERQFDQIGRKYFMGDECLKRWMRKILFPPEPVEPPPAPEAPEAVVQGKTVDEAL